MPERSKRVLMTREQRDLLAMVAQDDIYDESGPRFAEMVAAWDAAPVDPVAASATWGGEA